MFAPVANENAPPLSHPINLSSEQARCKNEQYSGQTSRNPIGHVVEPG
jgi:hypothetical protein